MNQIKTHITAEPLRMIARKKETGNRQRVVGSNPIEAAIYSPKSNRYETNQCI